VRVNERIRAKEVRVIDEEGKQLGIMPPFEALKMARNQGLDVVEVAPTANPPVCRIINYGKYLYQLSKRQHEARKHQKSIELKEVKFRPRTSAHDFEVKRNRIVGFLQEGDKVKASIMFRGRENAHRDLGMRMMERLIQEIGEVGQVETRPRQEGPTLTAILAPNKKAVVKPPAHKPRPSGESPSAPVHAKPSPRPQVGAAKAAATPESPETSGG
jgi:translation initiation factor IF-3